MEKARLIENRQIKVYVHCSLEQIRSLRFSCIAVNVLLHL